MNKFFSILGILIVTSLTIWLTILAGQFTGTVRTVELILAGLSLMRIIVILFRRDK